MRTGTWVLDYKSPEMNTAIRGGLNSVTSFSNLSTHRLQNLSIGSVLSSVTWQVIKCSRSNAAILSRILVLANYLVFVWVTWSTYLAAQLPFNKTTNLEVVMMEEPMWKVEKDREGNTMLFKSSVCWDDRCQETSKQKVISSSSPNCWCVLQRNIC